MELLNRDVAARLRQAADLLAAQGASPVRVTACRRAAEVVDGLDASVAEIVARAGPAGLAALPGVGGSLAAAMAEMVRTGRWALLDRLQGEVTPETLFETIAGIGPTLAHRLHTALHVETLEDLEAAARDGRLEVIPGVGPRRLQRIRNALAAALAPVRDRPDRELVGPAHDPPLAWLLDVDREYRERAAAGRLPMIAPRRFNPKGLAWLPALHTERGEWHFTALYSNTARAHQLGRTRDWVVLYFTDGDHRERQCTVVTETRGPHAGERVVRGREAEQFADATASGAAAS